MRPGDLLVVNTKPPHIALVMSASLVICEDGTELAYDPVNMTKLYDALDIVKELERSVLQQNETR